MKARWRMLFAVFGMLLITTAALLWWLPARWAWPWFAPRMPGIALEGLHGTLWDGRADSVRTSDGRELGRLEWRLSRRSLLGDPAGDFALHGAFDFTGHVQRAAPDTLDWRNVRIDVNLDALAVPALGGTPHGRLGLSLPHLRLQGGWPLQLDGTAHWRDAALSTPGGRVTLGACHASLHAEGGALLLRFADDGGGPLAALGELRLLPLGWRFTARLTPHSDDAALHRWLTGLGTPQADGTLRIERSGGLLHTDKDQAR